MTAQDDWSALFSTAFRQSRNAMTKLGARSRAHLVARAPSDGLTFE